MPDQTIEFEWDGRDAFGRTVQGVRQASIRIGYEYQVYFAMPGPVSASFAVPGLPSNLVPARRTQFLWQEQSAMLGGIDARGFGLGGWLPSNLHLYDPTSRTLLRGGGSRETADAIGRIITTVAGTGARGYNGDGIPATSAMLASPRDVAVARNGDVYIADTGNQRIRRIDRNGTITTVAAGPTFTSVAFAPDGALYAADFGRVYRIDGSTPTPIAGGGSPPDGLGDDGPATEAAFGSITGIAFGPDGSLYVADEIAYRIRRILPNGIVLTVAGIGSYGYEGDGGPATDATIGFAWGVGVTRQGQLFFGTNGYPDGLIRSVSIDGTIARVGGIPEVYDPIEPVGGVPATETTFDFLLGMSSDAAGNVYVSTSSPDMVRVIDQQGIVRIVAGDGTRGFAGDGGLPERAQLNGPGGTATGPDGSVYIATNRDSRIRRVAPSLPGLKPGEYAVPSSDGAELYVFNEKGLHIRTVAILGDYTLATFGYTAEGLLSFVRDRDGNVTSIQRDGNGNPVAIIAPGGVRTDITLSPNGYIESVSNPNRERHEMTYTSKGLLTSFRKPRGNTWTFSYDSMGRLVRDTDPAGGFKELVPTDSAASRSVDIRTVLGRTTSITRSVGLDGSIETVTVAPGGETTRSVKDSNGVTSTRTPDGTTVKVTESPDPRYGVLASYVSMVEVTTPGGRNAVFETQITDHFDTPGDPSTFRNRETWFFVNGQYRGGTYFWKPWTGTYTALGRSSDTALDEKGRPIEHMIRGLATTFFNWRSDGLLSSVQRGTRQTSFTWTPEQELESVTDPLNRTVSFVYDDAGRVTRQMQPDGRVIEFAYDENGNLTRLTPPGKPGHLFTWTNVDQAATYEPPSILSGNTDTIYSYDLEKKLRDVLRPDGTRVDLTYDAAGRLSALAHATGTLTYGYDGAGRLLSIHAGTQSLGYTWDGMLLTSVTWTGEVNGSVEYDYDNEFRVVAETVNGANPIAYAFDADGLVTGVGSMSITRNLQNGLITGTTLGNVTDTYGYNEHGEAMTYEAKYAGATVFRQAYTRDAAGRIATKTEMADGVTTTYGYTYDAAGRLHEVTTNGTLTASYSYDANGNRLSKTSTSGSEAGTYDDQDRMLTYGGMSYTYTLNGDLKTKADASGTTTYDYDALGNLRRADLPDGRVIEYVIDGQNRRVGRKVNGSLERAWIYAGQLTPVAELDASGTVISRFEGGMMIRGGVTYRVIGDHLGSPRMIIDASTGAVLQRMDFDELGNVVGDSNPGFQPFGFAGGLVDRDTGVTRFGARDYELRSGRWTAKDPIGFDGGDANLYGYVINDPVNFVDADGRFPRRTDKLYGLPKKFWNWYHRKFKEKADPNIGPEDARRLAEEWKRAGCPAPDNKKPKRNRRELDDLDTEWWEDLLDIILPVPPLLLDPAMFPEWVQPGQFTVPEA